VPGDGRLWGEPVRVNVQTTADDRGDRIPRRILLDARTVYIDRVLDQWPGGDYRYFKVKGEDGNIYILRADERRREWDLTLFRRPGREMED